LEAVYTYIPILHLVEGLITQKVRRRPDGQKREIFPRRSSVLANLVAGAKLAFLLFVCILVPPLLSRAVSPFAKVQGK
jgi:hypothetical protein